jgi:hypothetical protein
MVNGKSESGEDEKGKKLSRGKVWLVWDQGRREEQAVGRGQRRQV